jgi:hypothetical protein
MTIITTITTSIVKRTAITTATPTTYARDECEIENENDDHSHDNTNENTLSCVNNVQNINNALLGIVP